MNLKRLPFLLLAAVFTGPVWAVPTVVTDGYVGSNDHGYGDVIGSSTYFDIASIEAELVGTSLQVTINTNFAGRAGIYSSSINHGIGYGDLFLGSAWTPYGAAPYLSDNNATGTLWSYGLALDNTWSNSGGNATLYELNGATNNANALLSEDLINCCTFRNGQEVLVDERSATVSALGNAASWSVDSINKRITLSLDLSGTDLLLGDAIALHWGPTCANDVIEGSIDVSVPEPGSITLLGGGLLLLLAGPCRRRVLARRR